MAINPMQRKANNYLLIGIVGTLLITGTIIGFLFYRYQGLKKDLDQINNDKTTMIVASAEFKAGDPIDGDELENRIKRIMVPKEAVPEDMLDIGQFQNTLVAEIDELDAEGEASIVEKLIMTAKIDIQPGTPLTNAMFYPDKDMKNLTSKTTRYVEYNVISLPTQLETGDYVDIRLRLPSGADYVVASRKRVTIPKIEDFDTLHTIQLTMNELEIETMSSAIIESYMMEGSKLYAIKLTDPGIGLQTEAQLTTYVPNYTVSQLIQQNPNLFGSDAAAIEQALTGELWNRIVGERGTTLRNQIQSALPAGDDMESAMSKVTSKVSEEVAAALEERQKYLESLGGTY